MGKQIGLVRKQVLVLTNKYAGLEQKINSITFVAKSRKGCFKIFFLRLDIYFFH